MTSELKNVDYETLGPESFWGNCQNFFLVSLPLLIVAFVTFRMLFKLTFNYKISKIFRKFDFWGFFFLLVFDGNIQQFAFYLASELNNLFFFSFMDKIMKTFAILFGYCLCLMTVAFFFLTFSFYRKLNHYLMDNNKNNIQSQFLLIAQFGIRNFCYGFFQFFFRYLDYTTGILILIFS